MSSAVPVPLPVPAGETGLPDSQWITDVRDALRDWPLYVNESKTADGTSGGISSTSGPYRVSRNPINDGSLTVSVAGAAQTVIESGTPTGAQVLVNYDTGEMFFGTTPTAGQAVAVSYQTCRWRDRTILTALYAGLRKIFPRSGKVHQDPAIRIGTNVWEYPLPGWAQEPRAVLLRVQVRDPDILTQDWEDINRYERVGSLLRIPSSQKYSTAARVRIIGWGPYVELADLEPQLYHLPIWYAAGTLLVKWAALQARSDSMPATESGSQKIADQSSLGQMYMGQFQEAMAELQRAPGPGRRFKIVTTYEQ